jgi:hypothetical protein
MAEITYEVVKPISVLSNTGKGWTKEVNLVSWNNGSVKLDIREWDHDNSKMKKGITLNRSEVNTLKSILSKLDLKAISERYIGTTGKKKKNDSEAENDFEYEAISEDEEEDSLL